MGRARCTHTGSGLNPAVKIAGKHVGRLYGTACENRARPSGNAHPRESPIGPWGARPNEAERRSQDRENNQRVSLGAHHGKVSVQHRIGRCLQDSIGTIQADQVRFVLSSV